MVYEFENVLHVNPSSRCKSIITASSNFGIQQEGNIFFMPNREKWSVIRAEGNPAQSQEVDALIKLVKKKKVQKQAAESKTKRPMFGDKSVAMHDILKKMGAASGQTATHASH
jgi:hypothetical protein